MTRQQQRFISDLTSGVHRRLDPQRTFVRSAISARQKPGLSSEAGNEAGDQDGERRFSRSAGREISDAYDRDQRAIGLRTAQSRLCDLSDERPDRGK